MKALPILNVVKECGQSGLIKLFFHVQRVSSKIFGDFPTWLRENRGADLCCLRYLQWRQHP